MKTKEAKITSLENHFVNLEEKVINLNDKIINIEKEKDKPTEKKSTKLCDSIFPCDKCEKVYKSKSGLTSHMNSHEVVVQVDGNIALSEETITCDSEVEENI